LIRHYHQHLLNQQILLNLLQHRLPHHLHLTPEDYLQHPLLLHYLDQGFLNLLM
jgi:hypothetical protein